MLLESGRVAAVEDRLRCQQVQARLKCLLQAERELETATPVQMDAEEATPAPTVVPNARLTAALAALHKVPSLASIDAAVAAKSANLQAQR